MSTPLEEELQRRTAIYNSWVGEGRAPSADDYAWVTMTGAHERERDAFPTPPPSPPETPQEEYRRCLAELLEEVPHTLAFLASAGFGDSAKPLREAHDAYIHASARLANARSEEKKASAETVPSSPWFIMRDGEEGVFIDGINTLSALLRSLLYGYLQDNDPHEWTSLSDSLGDVHPDSGFYVHNNQARARWHVGVQRLWDQPKRKKGEEV